MTLPAIERKTSVSTKAVFRVHLFRTEPLQPFNDQPGDLLVANRTLADWQAEAFSTLGLTVVEEPMPPYLEIPDNLFCTADALRQFLRGADGHDAVLVLGKSRFGDASTPVQRNVLENELGWRFERVRIRMGDGGEAREVVVDPDEVKIDLPMNNPYLDSDRLEIGLPRAPIMQLDHWVHLLWANQVAGGVEALKTPKWLWFVRVLWAAIKSFSVNRWKILAGLNRIGKDCDIHPTSIIEGSTLGRGVTVGPYARVMMSNVDDNAVIMAGAQVEFSTLGKQSMVSEQSVLRFSLLYPKAVASQYLMQQCILGREAVTTGGAFTMDLNFDREVRVPLDGELHSTGQQFLGCAFGHGSRIGTGFWLASGRTIPNGYFVIRDPEETLSIIPDGLPQQSPLLAKGRRLQQLEGKASEKPPSDDPTGP